MSGRDRRRIKQYLEFLSHSDLNWNPARWTQYLKDDCLKVRITKVTIKEI